MTRAGSGSAGAPREDAGGPPPADRPPPREPEADAWTTRRIRRLRPPRPGVDPRRPIGHAWETERRLGGGARRVLTVFLAGAECPFTCLFCDLWRHTLEGATPAGAIPRQLAAALDEAEGTPGRDEAGHSAHGDPEGAALKLYNASNFFDDRAVPPEDDARIASLCAGFARVTVECHPRLLGARSERFADALDGRLEVAMGLETVHPEVFPRLNKGMTRERFDDAVAWAGRRGMGTRAFVLVGLPWVAPGEFARWAAASAAHAAAIGVDRVSLIPLRTGNGALDALARDGHLARVTLAHVEDALARALDAVGGRSVVEADPWDLAGLAVCPECGPARIEALEAANLAQAAPAGTSCGCGG